MAHENCPRCGKDAMKAWVRSVIDLVQEKYPARPRPAILADLRDVMRGTKFGDPDYDWSPGGAQVIANEIMWNYD